MKPAVVLLVMAGLLVGCGGQTAAGPSPLPALASTPTSSASAATTPSSALPVVPKPADADAFTSEGAASFVRYYVAVINQAVRFSDPRLLSSLSAPECDSCQNYINSINYTIAKHGHVERGRLQVIDAVAPAIQDGETTVLLAASTTRYISRGPDGQVKSDLPAEGRFDSELRCVRKGNTWFVMGFRLAPVGGG